MNDIYIVYSVDSSYEDKIIYPDDPRVIEALVVGFSEAIRIVQDLRTFGDPNRLYGIECWEVFQNADEYFCHIFEED